MTYQFQTFQSIAEKRSGGKVEVPAGAGFANDVGRCFKGHVGIKEREERYYPSLQNLFTKKISLKKTDHTGSLTSEIVVFRVKFKV